MGTRIYQIGFRTGMLTGLLLGFALGAGAVAVISFG